jgi:hypothetical protein
MRISKDPSDKAFSETAERRRVWSRDVEVMSWVTADEFRRVVIKTDGQVMNGDCRIERLPEDSPQPEPVATVEEPVDAGFAGAGLVHVPDHVESPKPVVEEVPQAEELHPAAEQATLDFSVRDTYLHE